MRLQWWQYIVLTWPVRRPLLRQITMTSPQMAHASHVW